MLKTALIIVCYVHNHCFSYCVLFCCPFIFYYYYHHHHHVLLSKFNIEKKKKDYLTIYHPACIHEQKKIKVFTTNRLFRVKNLHLDGQLPTQDLLQVPL